MDFDREYKNLSVKLADGTTLSNLKLNGNNFISTVPIDEEMFKYNTSPVTFQFDGEEEVHEHMELIQITQPSRVEWWFVLADLTRQEVAMQEMRSQIDYIKMMTDVE